MEGRKRRGEIGPIFPWPFNVRISCFEPSCKKLSFDTTIEVYRGSTRIQESVGRQPASCLHSSITGCRENSPAYCSSSIQLFPLSVSRHGSIVNPNRQRFKPRFFLSFFPPITALSSMVYGENCEFLRRSSSISAGRKLDTAETTSFFNIIVPIMSLRGQSWSRER